MASHLFVRFPSVLARFRLMVRAQTEAGKYCIEGAAFG
jgi:hypothetical protein